MWGKGGGVWKMAYITYEWPIADYHVKKRKLRSQVEDSASSGGGGGNGSSGGTSGGGGTSGTNPTQVDSNKNALNAGNGNTGSVGGNGNRPSSEPLNDIEKYLNIRRQVTRFIIGIFSWIYVNPWIPVLIRWWKEVFLVIKTQPNC